MATVSPSPSPFATLLRRSKFASFDPRIGQVYTTYGGNAYRGNWGLKRPLAIRRRGATITVNSVDTSAQQTEWNSGEKQHRFIKHWEELNHESVISPKTLANSIGPAVTREWVDSEYAPTKEIGPSRPQAVRNIHSMSPRQFRAYLEKLRKMRPAFIEFLRERAENDPRLEGKSLYEIAQLDGEYHADFISRETHKSIHTVESRQIETIPHKTGGLLYSHPSRLQTYLTTKPQPGRILTDAIRRAKAPEGYLAAFAGAIHWVLKANASGIEKMKWTEGRDTTKSVGQFRMAEPVLRQIPRIVGVNKQGIKGFKARLEAQAAPKDEERNRSNTHLPGSLDYINAAPSPRGRIGSKISAPANFDFARTTQRATQWTPNRSSDSQRTMDVLQSILNRGQSSGR